MSSFVHGDNIFVDLEILFVATFVKIIFQLKCFLVYAILPRI
jgi:hypothetical protein